MKQTIGFSEFLDSFPDTYKNNFTYEGKKALFEDLESWEEETGEELELDPIGLCCDFTEYDDFEDFKASYPDIGSMDELRDNTDVIMIPNSDRFIIRNF